MELLRYVDGDYNDPTTFAELRKQLGEAKRPLHYLAVPPSLFATVAEALAESGSAAEDARLVIEKPFGHNRETARALSRLLTKYFPDENILRIDHYLGKESVQNITYTRFANLMFELKLLRGKLWKAVIASCHIYYPLWKGLLAWSCKAHCR